MSYRRIRITPSGDCAIIRLLPRPAGDGGGVVTDDGVTIDEATAAELRECCRELALCDGLRAVGIYGIGAIPGNGAGAGNSAGNDDGVGAGDDGDGNGNGDSPAGRRIFAIGRHQPPLPELRAAAALASLPMPVVAALNGDALAHGLELALAADLRVASAGARLGAGRCHPAADGFPYDGATQRLPRLAGPAIARDLLFTGRTISAAEALAAGLVNRVAPDDGLDDAVSELLAIIAASAPIAARYAKEAVQAAGDLPLAQGLRLEADLSIILQSTDDRAEGLRAFAEKRPPVFHGR